MIASISTRSSRSSVPRLQPFHNPLTRSSTLTILPKTYPARHQTLGPNVRHLAKANNKVDSTSDPTEAQAVPMEATLAKDAIRLTDVDPNKLTGLTLRTTRVTRVNRMEAREVLPEDILSKIDRIALHLNRGIEAFCFFGFGPFYCFSNSHNHNRRWPKSTNSMRPDDGNPIFYCVHILTAIRTTRPGSSEFNFRCGVLGGLRDGVR